MFNKKKRNFLILVLIFCAITVVSLAYAWKDGGGMANESMMGQTMGSMMSMHLQNVTISDLIRQQKQMDLAAATSGDEHSGHHSDTESFLQATNKLTTGTIIILLPFIIAGSIFLTIVWFGNQKPGGKT